MEDRHRLVLNEIKKQIKSCQRESNTLRLKKVDELRRTLLNQRFSLGRKLSRYRIFAPANPMNLAFVGQAAQYLPNGVGFQLKQLLDLSDGERPLILQAPFEFLEIFVKIFVCRNVLPLF